MHGEWTDQTRKTYSSWPTGPSKKRQSWLPSNTCVKGQSAKKRLYHQGPHEIKMGPFDLRTTTMGIQWSWMLPEEGLGSTSRPKNTNEECEAIYASNALSRDIERLHAEARPTARKERHGNQGTTTKNNGDHQSKPGKWR